MAVLTPAGEARVAVLVDCDNVSPEILEHALRVVAQFGRVVLRRGYGNHGTLANRWQEALVRLAFTPCLQYQYAAGKNTSDIALALDALEALFDHRADTFCLVTSDSDFAYLCRKLRERGATVCIVGENKTPAALRNASDQFFEWRRDDHVQEQGAEHADSREPMSRAEANKHDAAKVEPEKPVVKTPTEIRRRCGRSACRRNQRRQGNAECPWPISQTNRPRLFAKLVWAFWVARHDQNVRSAKSCSGDWRPLECWFSS